MLNAPFEGVMRIRRWARKYLGLVVAPSGSCFMLTGTGRLLGPHLYVPGPLWPPLPEMGVDRLDKAGPRKFGKPRSPPSNLDTQPDGSLRCTICEMTVHVL